MAARSLGVLTLDLVMKTAGFVTGATQAERAADKLSKKIKSSFGGMKGVIAGAFGGFTIAAAINGIVRNTIEAEDALRQLEARIKSTGGVAGVSSEELQAMAKELQGLTTFGDDAILAMQGVLLTFTNIRGGTVRQATEAILNLATAMGTDLQSAAVLVGKALNDPVKGATALARAGVQLSESQKGLIKDFVAVGDAASAQQIILGELETQFGGAAEAASETFGGALKQLQNAFGDLLEANGGLNEATGAIQEMTGLLKDPETVAAAQTLTTALFTGFRKVTEAVAGTVNTLRFLGEELAARMHGANVGDIVRLEEELERLEELRRSSRANIGDRLRFFGKEGVVEWYSNEDLDKAIAEVKAKIKATQDLAGPLLAPPKPGAGPAAASGGAAPTGPALPTLEEIRITVKQIDRSPVDEFYDKLKQQQQTATQRALSDYYEQKEALDELWRAGLIGVNAYNERLDEINAELLPEIEVTAKKIPEVYKKQTEELSEFQKEAARNTQNIIADTLVSGFDEGAQGVLDAFTKMLTQMAAQAVAADIGSYLFGAEGGGKAGSVGVLDSLFGLFGGGKAAGGPVAAGRPYMVGELGPELIVPRAAGTVVPNHQLGATGGGIVNQVIQVSGTVSQRTARQLQIEASRQQRIANARFGG